LVHHTGTTHRMLQNRVDPFGNIIKTTARGTFMGNRGRLHNEHQELRYPFVLKAWITCLLEFKGRQRQVMSPNTYTELFFLDEATSFAAGHRPCFECRRLDYDRFKQAWLKGNPQYGFHDKTSIKEIDSILHHERITPDKQKLTFEIDPWQLPNGSFVLYEEEPWLVKDASMHLWTPFGYEKKIPLPSDNSITVLTPGSTINAFKTGYTPLMQLS